MSHRATTWQSLCCRKASSTWSPRLPSPMNPSRTRSPAPRTREALRAVVSEAAARVAYFPKSLRVSLLMARSPPHTSHSGQDLTDWLPAIGDRHRPAGAVLDQRLRVDPEALVDGRADVG